MRSGQGDLFGFLGRLHDSEGSEGISSVRVSHGESLQLGNVSLDFRRQSAAEHHGLHSVGHGQSLQLGRGFDLLDFPLRGGHGDGSVLDHGHGHSRHHSWHGVGHGQGLQLGRGFDLLDFPLRGGHGDGGVLDHGHGHSRHHSGHVGGNGAHDLGGMGDGDGLVDLAIFVGIDTLVSQVLQQVRRVDIGRGGQSNSQDGGEGNLLKVELHNYLKNNFPELIDIEDLYQEFHFQFGSCDRKLMLKTKFLHQKLAIYNG